MTAAFAFLLCCAICLRAAVRVAASPHCDAWFAESETETDPSICDLDRIPIDQLTLAIFEGHKTQPFVIVDDVNRQAKLRAAVQRQALIEAKGDVEVTLSSSNTHSYAKKTSLLLDYVNEMRSPRVENRAATETFYMFGDTTEEDWSDLFALYKMPPFADTMRQPALSFGIGRDLSGVQLHVHGPVFAETLHGRKQWILVDPEHENPPPFDVNQTSYDFARFNLPQSATMCTIFPGEILWIPDGYWHATINIGEAVFISAFV